MAWPEANKMSPEDKQKILDDMEQQIKMYTKWIEEYKIKIEAVKYIIMAVKANDDFSKR